MTTPAKLFGKNLGEYDEVDVDELLAQLSAEEIKILAKEVDPDVSCLEDHIPTNSDTQDSRSHSHLIFPHFCHINRTIFCRQVNVIITIVKRNQLDH